MNEPLISVIVPVYKVEKYLDECVESIVNQTYRNLEIILVDDGSPDNCPQICDDWAKKDERIRVIHKENGGLSSARNAGLDVCKGEYIAFVDSDDFIHRDYVFKMAEKAFSMNVELVICDYARVDAESHIVKENANLNVHIEKELLSQKDLYDELCIYNPWWSISAGNKLYKRNLFKNLCFLNGKLCEDAFFIHHLYEKVENACYIKCPLYYYRYTPNSIMMRPYNEAQLDEVEAVCDRLHFLHAKEWTQYYSTVFLWLLNKMENAYYYLGKKDSERLRELKINYDAEMISIYKYLSLRDKIRAFLFRLFPDLYTCFFTARHQ
mgnify:CR=1 FL=1